MQPVSSNPDIMSLPSDVLRLVLMRFPSMSLGKLSRVCKRFKTVIDEPKLKIRVLMWKLGIEELLLNKEFKEAQKLDKVRQVSPAFDRYFDSIYEINLLYESTIKPRLKNAPKEDHLNDLAYLVPKIKNTLLITIQSKKEIHDIVTPAAAAWSCAVM